MKDKDYIVIKKMIDYCNNIEELMERFDNDFEKYKTDISFQYSCNMCILQIGELVSRLSEEIKDNNSDIPWNSIKAMRNIHAHDYEKYNDYKEHCNKHIFKIYNGMVLDDDASYENSMVDVLVEIKEIPEPNYYDSGECTNYMAKDVLNDIIAISANNR